MKDEKMKNSKNLRPFKDFVFCCNDGFRVKACVLLCFPNIAKIENRRPFKESVISGGPKMDLGGLGARDEIKRAKVHGIEKKTLHLVSCKTRVRIPYVISCFFVTKSLSSCCFQHFLCLLLAKIPACL